MGRSKRQQQQSPVQLSLVAKQPKDYSRLNLLRKKAVGRELSSTPRSTKLNAVMQMDPPGGRRRLGRNPVAEQQQQQQQQDSSSSPTDADSSNEAGQGGSTGNSAECRRSSRKKTIKFDVRDLLNKNRKSHKIQIEARIDSNAPKVGAGQVSKAELDSKQKNFIEKSAIFRRYSISENKLPPRPPPPPGALIHTIQQCVGELEQLPLDGGEINLAAISPIARRLSRTQDILTASMMKPKQVSSLIVTKLESASTSKAAIAASSSTTAAKKRAAAGGCKPSTSTAILKKPQKRGRKPKAKLFAESTTESSMSSSDSFDLSANRQTPVDKGTPNQDVTTLGRNSLLDENSTTGIDLNESLDASAVTLPQPIIMNDSMHNSTDDSFVAAQEDVFTLRNHSSDESTSGSSRNSPKGRKADEISLFGRSNSTETNSSDDSEKRHRKIRVAVKRVSLTPQKSPLAICVEETAEPIELLSSTNDENSNEDAIISKRNPATKILKGKQVEMRATPPIILLESDTSNAASVSSSVIEITSCLGMPNDESEQIPSMRRGRSCKLTDEVRDTQKSTLPQIAEISPRYRSSSRKSAPHLPPETIAANSPSRSLTDDAQSTEDVVFLEKDDTVQVGDDVLCKDTSLSQHVSHVSEEVNEETNEKSKQNILPQVRSLRSALSVQVKPPTPTGLKRQRKSNKVQSPEDNPTEQASKIQMEVSPMLLKVADLDSFDHQELNISNQGQDVLSESPNDSGSPTQSLTNRRNKSGKSENRHSSESDTQEQVVLSKPNRFRGLKKHLKSDGSTLMKDKSLSDDKDSTTSDEKNNQAGAEEDYKSDREESIYESTDRSSTDSITTLDRRRESSRLRSTVLPTKKENPKKIPKNKTNSSTPDSSSEGSECHEKISKSRRQTILRNARDEKSKEETSSLCSESSSNASSATSSSLSSSSSSSSSLTASSSTNSSKSLSSSSSKGRSTRSSGKTQEIPPEEQVQIEAIRRKSPVSPKSISKTQTKKSDSGSSDNLSKTGQLNDIKFHEIKKLVDRRKSTRLQRSSSEPDRDTEESETPHGTKKSPKTRSARSKSRADRSVEVRKHVSQKTFHQDSVAPEVEVGKTTLEADSTQITAHTTGTSTEESKGEGIQTGTSTSPRAKSKKRTRRFVPIKYSSSESGTLSDDGTPSDKMSSIRLTRTRRKTISSASEIEDFPAANLSPPDLALEYVRRKSKQPQIKTTESIETNSEKLSKPSKKSDEEDSFTTDSKEGKTAEQIITPKVKAKVGRPRKNRNTSKCRIGDENKDSTDASKESETDQSSRETNEKQVQHADPPSPSPSDSSEVDSLSDVTRERKVTRLSLKTQASDFKNKESKDFGDSTGNKERVVEKGTMVELPEKNVESNKTQLDCDLKIDKNNKIPTLDDVNCISEDALDSEVSQSKSPKQRKGAKMCSKSPVCMKSKQESNENNSGQSYKETGQTTEPQDKTVSQISSTINEHSDNLPDLSKLTPSNLDSASSPKLDVLQHNEIDKIKEIVPHDENKEDHNSKPVESEQLSEARKETPLSLKCMDSASPENKSRETSLSDKTKTQVDSTTLDTNQPVKTPRQRKPTRFSPKSPEGPNLEESSQAQGDSKVVERVSDISPSRIKTTRTSPNSSNSKDVEDSLPAECPNAIELKLNESSENSKLKVDAPLKLSSSENISVPENLDGLLSDVLKLPETPKRKRKPTRFSPKSPDRPTTGAIASEEQFKEVSNDQINETKRPEEPNNISTSSIDVSLSETLTKTPRVRKGTRFSPKNAENIQIQPKQQQQVTVEGEHPNLSGISEVPSDSASEKDQAKEPSKLTRTKKVTQHLAKCSENSEIEEELKKLLHDSPPSQHELTEKLDDSISSCEKKQTKKGSRFSQQPAQDSGDIEDCREKKKMHEIEPLSDVKEALLSDESYMSKTSGDQIHPTTENVSEQMSNSQSPEKGPLEVQESTRDVLVSSNCMSEQQLVTGEVAVKCAERTNLTDVSVHVPSSPSMFKSDLTTKRGMKKQMQSMLDSLTSEQKVSNAKETTPRRKRKTLGQPQDTTIPAEDSPAERKSDEPSQDVEMKVLSSNFNPTDDSLKPQDGTNENDLKHKSRRQLDSSFIESLEKSLLRPVSNKKISKKKEKDKELIEVSPALKPTKEDSKKSVAKKSQDPCEELKKPENSSPKLKKKQQKESPKVVKKHPEEQTAPKRKSVGGAKAKEHEEVKLLGLSLSDSLNEDSKMKQSSETVAPVLVVNQTPKTKAETKFFSPDKRLIHDELAVVKKPPSPVARVKEKSPDLLPDPLKDIEKFIEDGVNLLKRSYKIDADDDTSLDRDTLKSDEVMTSKKCKLDESAVEGKPEEPPPDDENSNSNSESSTMTTNTSTSEVDTPNGIRRSHRIKNNSKSTKCLVGRGLVRERERFSTKDDEKTIYSIDDQKMDLAEVEAKNSKFLKDMEERLSNFRVIRENEYKCERVISKEAKRMLCDCFLTHEEEERGELGCGEDCLNRLLMIECGGDCTVRDRCTNRRFNKFLYSPCRVFRTEKKGFGIMADIEILPGEFIMEYVGEVINGDEFEIRINEYSKDKNKHYYFMALRSDAVIDATAKGNISRFINHSCDPNAETQKWTVNGELRIGFFSRKSIMPGEEITFDYQYQRYGKEAQRCYCESSNCRGWIGAEPSSEEEEEYEGVDEEDESEETEEEEPSQPVVPVPVISTATPAMIDVANAVEQPLVPVVVTEVPAVDAETVPSILTLPQPVAAPTPLTELIPAVAVEKPKEQVVKKKKEKKRLLEEKLKRREPKQFLEDPDIEDEVRFLVKCGLRNQADTLRLSRLIVRAKLLETRINLLQILRQGELPCRRLFLDYHGLRLLHGWMSEVIDTRDTEKSMEIRMELLSALECLPISNKTMLTDSKVYQTVRDWSNNKESHSPSDGSPKEANVNTPSATSTPPTEDGTSELQKLAAKLVHTWDNLPEIFRIPKRERIEQMKEHEREADRQYKVLERGLMSGPDRNRNSDRFISKSGQKGRFKWSKEKERERTNERRKYAQNNGSGKDGTDKVAGAASGESHLSKEQRRELFAAKVARDEAEKRQAEERREFDIKCRFFGLDPKRMRPENMPFCVNPSTGQWYSTDRKAISTPPSYAHVQVPVKPKSTNPEDYRLPKMDLPPLWKFAISPKGKIYYYHVKIRIPQWDPPIKILPLAGQHNTEAKSSESDSSTAGINESSEDDIEVIKGLDPVKLQAYIEKKIEDRRLQRYTRLVEEKSISPRKEEDRIYNQMEVRKYKENKEKIRKRKEEIRRRRDNIVKQTNLESSNLSENAEAVESVAETLPIQDYLLSSEEEEILKAECNNSPLIDKIVQGDKIVDELDALQRKRALKRALPIRDKYEHKKRKLDKNKESSKSTKRNKDGEGSSSSSKYRKVREKFRCEIAGIIVQHLKPYRDEDCFAGKILTDEDFNHLARKLTHFVMVKELKYCESIGQTLIVTESVKNKSREFIKKYMAKYGKVYVRPKNDPEFKDIPFL